MANNEIFIMQQHETIFIWKQYLFLMARLTMLILILIVVYTFTKAPCRNVKLKWLEFMSRQNMGDILLVSVFSIPMFIWGWFINMFSHANTIFRAQSLFNLFWRVHWLSIFPGNYVCSHYSITTFKKKE